MMKYGFVRVSKNSVSGGLPVYFKWERKTEMQLKVEQMKHPTMYLDSDSRTSFWKWKVFSRKVGKEASWRTGKAKKTETQASIAITFRNFFTVFNSTEKQFHQTWWNNICATYALLFLYHCSICVGTVRY